MQNGDGGSPSIILVGQGLLVKILIILKVSKGAKKTTSYILFKLCILIHFNNSRPRGREFESHRRHCTVSLSKTH